jgi:hypothetical protein
MPKIPTFESQTRPTAEIGGVKSNIQMPFETSFTKMGSAIADYYVKEKTAEADTNALKTLSSLYGNQNDGTQGLYSIQDELKKNPNPSQAAVLYDQKIKQLWSSAENSSLANADNFTRKALEQKFYATANVFKQDVIKGSRDALFDEQKKLTFLDTQQGVINLKTLGENYLPIFNQDRYTNINKLSDLEPQQKKELIAEAISLGHKELAETIIEKNPESFNRLVKEGKLSLDNKSFAELVDKADKKVQSNLFNQITIGLDYTPQSTMKQAGQEFNKIIDGKFDNPNIQKAYNVLSDSQKNDLKKEAIRKYNEFQTIFSVRADESRRVQADGSKKAVDNVVKKANADLYDPNLIKESFKGNEKLINDFNQINILSSKNELLDSSAYPIKYEIMKNISSGNVIDVGTPFRLTGESTPMSLTERVTNKQISKSDLENFNTQFKIEKIDDKTKNNMTKFFDFVKSNELLIGGSPGVREIDSSYDKRMNLFIDEMYNRYNVGLSQGISADSLLNRNDSKNFIAKDAANYQLSRSQLDKEIDMQIRKFQDAKLYKVGEVITNSKGEKAVVVRIDENGKVILNRQ